MTEIFGCNLLFLSPSLIISLAPSLFLKLIGILLTSKLGCLSKYSKSTLIIFLSVLFLKLNLSFGPASTLKKVN